MFFSSSESPGWNVPIKRSRNSTFFVLNDFLRVGRQGHRREVALLWLIIKLIKSQQFSTHIQLYFSLVGSFSDMLNYNLSRRSTGGEFLLHDPCRNLSRHSAGGESVLHPVQESRLGLESILSFVGRGVSLTRPVLVAVLG